MSGATLNLPALQALIALGGYGGRAGIAPSSAVLGLSAALFLRGSTIWQGAGDTLTDEEIDDIDLMIAQLEYDLMVTDEMYPSDRCKISQAVGQNIPASTSTNLLWDVVEYDPQDMFSGGAGTRFITCVNDGLHLVSFNIAWTPNVVGYRKIDVRKNPEIGGGSFLIASHAFCPIVGTGLAIHNLEFQDYGLEGDTYSLRAYQSSPLALRILTANYSPFFSVVRL